MLYGKKGDLKMDWYDNVILPKLWPEVIRRWWDVKVPDNYPTDTGVDFTLDFGDNKDAVTAMEATLDTESPVVAPYVPENTFVQEYVGTFEAEGEGGEQILLSPVKINANAAVDLHYNADNDTCENIENVNVVNGYVYGDLATLSPIAVFAIRDDIELATNLEGINVVAGKGNPVKVYMEDDKVIAANVNSGTKIDITSVSPVFVIGGTYDGSDVEVASVSVDGVTHNKLRVYCGSIGTDDKVPNVGLAKAYVINSTIDGVSGSYYKAHTKKVEITIKDCDIKNHIAGGQSMYHGSKNKDGNAVGILDNTADWITDEVEMNIENTKTYIFYAAGASGLTYTKKAVANVKNCEFQWTCCGGSNGLTDEAKLVIDGGNFMEISNANRGKVKSATTILKNVTTTNGICITGDPDSTTTGTVDEVRYDIGSGCSSKVVLGYVGGEELKDNSIVKYVKYSRSADLDFAANVKEVLGEKLKMK